MKSTLWVVLQVIVMTIAAWKAWEVMAMEATLIAALALAWTILLTQKTSDARSLPPLPTYPSSLCPALLMVQPARLDSAVDSIILCDRSAYDQLT